MIGFLARTAARAAVRTAVRSHIEAKREARAVAATPFALHPRGDGESALFEHRGTGFAHLLPGHPKQGTATTSPIEHVHDALVALYALPMCVRYHLSRPQLVASSAQDFALQVAGSYIGARAAAPPSLRSVQGALLAAWAADAGALASYGLAYADPFGADQEDLVVVVRSGYAMAVTTRYARAEVHWVSRALLASAANASLSWDGSRLHNAQLWPASAFLVPGVHPVLQPQRVSELPYLAAEMALAPAERDGLATRLAAILSSEDPPWLPISPERAATTVAELSCVSQGRGLRTVLERQMQAVRTMHDLRGLAVQVGSALEGAG